LASKDISDVFMSGEHYVAQLLLGSQIIKEWLVDVLHHKLVQKSLSVVPFHHRTLIVSEDTRVFVFGVFKWNPHQVRAALLKVEWLNLSNFLYLNGLQIKFGPAVLYKFDGFIVLVVATNVPNIPSFFKPVFQLAHKVLISIVFQNPSQNLFLDG
jgi:hypothetical protein